MKKLFHNFKLYFWVERTRFQKNKSKTFRIKVYSKKLGYVLKRRNWLMTAHCMNEAKGT